jgi:uncharacterized protein involved in oxidation of intracellular sulfur
VDSFLQHGGTLLICMPCIEERKIPKDTLLEGTVPAKAGRAVMEVLDATNVLSY